MAIESVRMSSPAFFGESSSKGRVGWRPGCPNSGSLSSDW